MTAVRVLAAVVVASMLVALVAIVSSRPKGSTPRDSGVADAIVTATPEPVTVVLNPVADTYVDAGNQARNFGSVAILRIDGSPQKRAYLKFDLSGVRGEVEKATLRLYAVTRVSGGYELRQTSDNDWEEKSLTSLNAPLPGDVLGVGRSAERESWTELEVTRLVSLEGSLTFVVATGSGTQAGIASRESASPPELIVVLRPSVDTTGSISSSTPSAKETQTGEVLSATAVRGSDQDPRSLLTTPISESAQTLLAAGTLPPESNGTISQGSQYMVHAGDTLSSIAVRAEVPLDLLLEANSLTSDLIFEGQILLIPQLTR